MSVLHYFNSSGQWIAFRRNSDDRYLFDRQGNWVGWFPWDDNEIFDLKGEYLGVVMDGDRIYRMEKPGPQKRKSPGFPVHPGNVGYAGYPGHAAHSRPPFGYTDVTIERVPPQQQMWVRKTKPQAPKPSRLQLLMSWLGLRRTAKVQPAAKRRP